MGPSRHIARPHKFGRFSNRPFEVKHFQTIRHCNVDVAHGLALLFSAPGPLYGASFVKKFRQCNACLEPARQPEAVPAGLEGDRDPLDPASCLLRFLSPSMQQLQQCALVAIGERSDVILVAQSLAGFTAPLACARATARMIVFVNAMIPKPGEAAGAWWRATGAI